MDNPISKRFRNVLILMVFALSFASPLVQAALTPSAPVANDDIVTTYEGENIVINVLDNDTDADGFLVPQSLTLITDASYGVALVSASEGNFTYRPDAGFTGVDQFTYTVEDNDGLTSNVARVYVMVKAPVSSGTVKPSNQVPIANDDLASVNNGASVFIDVLANDTDLDGSLDSTSLMIVDEPSNGFVSIMADSTLRYNSNRNFEGVDTFTYTVEDNKGAVSNLATVTITVSKTTEDPSELNQAPTANDDEAEGNEDHNISVNVTANDFDTDGTLNLSTLEIEAGPFNGSLSVNHSNGMVTYSPDHNFSGVDAFQYTIEDNDGALSNIATVVITVHNLDDDAPIARDDRVDTEVNRDLYIDILANDSDDNDEIDPSTVKIVDQANHGDLSVNHITGVVKYSPDRNFEGKDTFEYTVKDEDGNESNRATVYVDVDEDGVIITGNDYDGDCMFHPFVDVVGHWVEDAIEGQDGLYCRNVVEGRDGTHFKPNAEVTRAEFLTILLRNLNVDILAYEDENEYYIDVNPSKWYYAYIVAGKELGIIDDEENYFRPNDRINRAEAAAMMVRVVELTENLRNPHDDEPFDDVDNRDWYGDVVALAYEYDLVEGYSNGDFRPQNDLSRAEAAEMANNIFEAFYR